MPYSVEQLLKFAQDQQLIARYAYEEDGRLRLEHDGVRLTLSSDAAYILLVDMLRLTGSDRAIAPKESPRT